ncbi:AAA family ATPase [Lentzea sp. NBRC 102530]|uniref:AAA family ATPase n=1 Tax=Lentzea sp. NBRC 102530 TaxID=3032201 RepID=UPI00255492E4|nr:AAA family ATPase [Lentzea sp. NBRC 102530]
MDEKPDEVVHQLFYENVVGDDYVASSSYRETSMLGAWDSKLRPHVGLVAMHHGVEPDSASSYLTFDDGTAAVVRQFRVEEPGHQSNAHVLVGDAATLDSHMSFRLHRWKGWSRTADAVPWAAELTRRRLVDESTLVPWLARVEPIARELADALSVLLDHPAESLGIVGCPSSERLSLVWGLRGAADGHLKSSGIRRRWSYSTGEGRDPREFANAPEIVFLSGEPQNDNGRVIVDFDRVRPSFPHQELAEQLVRDLLHIRPQLPRKAVTSPPVPPEPVPSAVPESGTFTQHVRPQGEPIRRALSIGVRDFDRDVRLEFAPARAHRLSQVFADLGYDAEWHTEERMSGEALGGHVKRSLESGKPEDLAVVHLVTHGEGLDGDATVFALGSDGKKHGDASIAHWLTMQQSDERPTTLFLLDLCGAGTAARLPWQVKLEQPLRGWVIAACSEHESAYDGRFTEAVVTVLEALREGELDIDPSLPHVPLTTVARAIRREVNRLAEKNDAYPQRVTATPVDISSDVEPPFFPNPGHDPADRPRLRAAVDPVKLPFLDDLDEGLDPRHFLERATGLGRLTDSNTGLVGCFTGRDRELKRVSPWLNGHGDEPPLCVVTGSPGAGKSALLGVLVCAASPDLRDATKQVWDRIVQAPLPLDRLAAVHARQRGVATVVGSVARQLDLPENLTTAELITALRTRPIAPVLVVDALDEADDPAALMNDFLLPLTDPDAPGNPVRLLVGVRNYDDFSPLFDRGWVLDLDEVEQHVLEDDLLTYVQNLLRTTAEYRGQGAVTGAFAHAVATTLAAPDEDGGRRWGPFLVAGLYTRHFLAANAEKVVTDAAVAAELGEKVPSDLGGVLELDLELERDHVWLRPVLTALAHARGAGMPVSVITRIVPIFAGEAATTAQVRAALAIARFYLRQQMDTDRSNVYRLFHQGLADTLAHPTPEVHGKILDALLSSLGPPENRDWNAAEPYLFRHVADHGVKAGRIEEIESDPGLLLHPDSSLALTAATDDSHAAAAVAANARLFAGLRTPAELALAAARAGRGELARRAANMAGEVPLTWQPLWSIGSQALPPAENVPPRFSSIAISQDGTVVVGLIGEALAVWNWPVGEPFGLDPDDILSCPEGYWVDLSADGRFAAAIGEEVTWFELGGTEAPRSLGRVETPLCAAVVTDSGLLGVTEDGRVLRFAGDDRVVEEIAGLDIGEHTDMCMLAEGADGVVVAYASVVTSQVALFDDELGEIESYPLDDQHTAVALSPDGLKLVVGLSDGSISVLDRGDGVERPVCPASGRAVTAFSFTLNGDLAAAFADGSVVFFDGEQQYTRSSLPAALPIVSMESAQGVRAVAFDNNQVAHCFDGTSAWRLPPFVRHFADDAQPDRSALYVNALHELGGGLVLALGEGPVFSVEAADGELKEIGDLLWGTTSSLDLAVVDVGGENFLLLAHEDGYHLTRGALDEFITIGPGDDWAAACFRRDDHSARIVVDGELVEVRHDADMVWMLTTNSGVVQGTELGTHVSCEVVHCAYVDGAPFAFTGGEDGLVLVWDPVSRMLHDVLTIGRPIRRIESVDGKYLVVRADGELLAFKKEGLK